MSKVRVYELARELGMDDSKHLIRMLKDMGFDVKSATSGLPADAVRKVKEVVVPHLEQKKKQVVEEKRKKVEADKKSKESSVAHVAAKPAVRMRIVTRPSEVQKQALFERQTKILAGETPLRSAAEAMERAEEQKRQADMAAAEARKLTEESARKLAEEAEKQKAVEVEQKLQDEAKQSIVEEGAKIPEQGAIAASSQSQVADPSSTSVVVSTSQERPLVEQSVAKTSVAKVNVAGAASTNAFDTEEIRRRELPPDQFIAAQYRKDGPPVAASKSTFSDKHPTSGHSHPLRGKSKGSVAVAGGDDENKKGFPKKTAASGKTREIALQGRGQKRTQFGFPRVGAGNKKKRRRRREVTDKVDLTKQVEIPEIISLTDLASRMEVPVSDVIKYLLKQGQMIGKNQGLSYDEASAIVKAYGFKVKESADEDDLDLNLLEEDDDPGDEMRPPVVTVLGHVDHGKTSLLDAIRKTNVTAGEAGGITQSIGAYNVSFDGRSVTFIDTPGHEAFTQMRARGAQVTDVAVLVVAADDGVMPQTIEAINHAKAAGVPIIVAMNKIDKSEANPDRLMQQLAGQEIVVEDWGGTIPMVKVSALKRTGIEELLEMINLVAEMQELRADSNRLATGVIIEAGLDKGLGPVATVLIKNGTLHVGDTVVVGDTHGRIRALISDSGQQVKEAGPSIPVSIVGLSDIPESGNSLEVIEDEKQARLVSQARTEKSRKERIQVSSRTTLEDLFASVKEGEQKSLKLLLKADSQGSIEALSASLLKLATSEVKVEIVHAAVGAISESDIMLASASDAIIIGFAVRPATAVKRLADQEGVEIRLYKVIYHVIEEVEKAMTGLLAPDIKEVELGKASVREVFKMSKVGKIAGCMVTEGKITRDSMIRLVRDGILIHEGKIENLRRFKDDVREVTEGYECGIFINNFAEIEIGDTIEAYKEEKVARESL